MQTLNQHMQHQITDLVEACGSYWALRGVAPAYRQDMQLELEQHIAQALRDGKSLTAVVGSNPALFAEAWAREMHPRWFAGSSTLLLHGFVCALCLLSFIALSSHLLLHTPSFTLTLLYPLVFAILGLFVLLVRLSGFLAPHLRTQDSRVLLAFTICYLPLLLLVLFLHKVGKLLWGFLTFPCWLPPLSLPTKLHSGCVLVSKADGCKTYKAAHMANSQGRMGT